MEQHIVPTRCSSLKSNLHDIVVYNNPKRKSGPYKSKEIQTHEDFNCEFDMKKARFEIYKFSHSNLDGATKQKSNLELAVKLGARPPKNKEFNYKELLQQRKQLKETGFEDQFLLNLKKEFKHKKTSGKNILRKKRRTGDGILKSYGQPTIKLNKSKGKSKDKLQNYLKK